LNEIWIEHCDVTAVDFSNWSVLTIVKLVRCCTTLRGLETLSLLEELTVLYCPQLEHIPELTCLKILQSLSVYACTTLSSMHNSLTDFELLQRLDVSKSGIGKAIADRTDVDLVARVSELQTRPGFQYTNHTGT
jgi:hypothetical protein